MRGGRRAVRPGVVLGLRFVLGWLAPVWTQPAEWLEPYVRQCREELLLDPTAERAFGDFVVARSQALCRFAFLLCGDWHRAEDAVQTAFTKLDRRWDRSTRPAAWTRTCGGSC